MNLHKRLIKAIAKHGNGELYVNLTTDTTFMVCEMAHLMRVSVGELVEVVEKASLVDGTVEQLYTCSETGEQVFELTEEGVAAVLAV